MGKDSNNNDTVGCCGVGLAVTAVILTMGLRWKA